MDERFFIITYNFCSRDKIELKVSSDQFEFYLDRIKGFGFNVIRQRKHIDDICLCDYYSYYDENLETIICFAKCEFFVDN